MKLKQSELSRLFLFFLTLILASFLMFWNLGKKPLRLWDESRLAANSIEMYRDGYSLVPTYKGKPDMWNTKPPMLIWIQTSALHVFGLNEWSIRIPSAISGVFLVVLLFFFLTRHGIHPAIAAVASLMTITATGAIMWHGFRFGDYDGFLTLITATASIALFQFSITRKPVWIWLAFILAALGVLTKSTGAILLFPAMGIYLLFTSEKNLPDFFRQIILPALAFLIIVFAYYSIRESINPGYLYHVNQNEIYGRYLEPRENNKANFLFYFNQLATHRYNIWIWILLACTPLSLLSEDITRRKLAVYSFVMWGSYFLIISFSKTKLFWYDLPAYPFMSITTGLGIQTLINRISVARAGYFRNSFLMKLFPYLFLPLLWPHLKNSVETVIKQTEPPYDEVLYDLQFYLRDIIVSQRDISNYLLITDEIDQRLIFYINKAHLEGLEIRTAFFDELRPGDKVIAENDFMLNKLNEKFNARIIAKDPKWGIRYIELSSKGI